MTPFVLPVLFTLLAWWLSTGLILYLDGLARSTFRWSFLGATALLFAGLYVLIAASGHATVMGAYAGFASGLLIWGWLEMSFLLGYVTGPRQTACPAGCSGRRHLGHALQSIAYHELVLVILGTTVVVTTWGEPNQVGTWTFVTLWIMRQSAKVNVFLGVRNLSEEFLPEHLRYLTSFFSRKPMNLLFPFSVTIATACAVLIIQAAAAPDASAFEATGLTFIATLLVLAILEHWLMVLPLPSVALWNWCLRSRTLQTFDAADVQPPRFGIRANRVNP